MMTKKLIQFIKGLFLVIGVMATIFCSAGYYFFIYPQKVATRALESIRKEQSLNELFSESSTLRRSPLAALAGPLARLLQVFAALFLKRRNLT
jgi:hypothetical protein